MQTVADMRGVGVKNRGKIADVLYGRPLTIYKSGESFLNQITVFLAEILLIT